LVCLVGLLVGAGLAMWLAGRRPVRVATTRH
jgi:hypothetical protein